MSRRRSSAAFLDVRGGTGAGAGVGAGAGAGRSTAQSSVGPSASARVRGGGPSVFGGGVAPHASAVPRASLPPPAATAAGSDPPADGARLQSVQQALTEPNQLVVLVREAQGLLDGDGDSVDPYAKLSFVGSKTKLQTSVVRRTAYPAWLEAFQMECSDPAAVLLVKVKSKGLFSGAPVGSAELPMASLTPGKECTLTLPLRDEFGKTQDGAVGRVVLSMAWVHRSKPSTSALPGSIAAFTSALAMAGVDASEDTQLRNDEDLDSVPPTSSEEDADQDDGDLSERALAKKRAARAAARAKRKAKRREKPPLSAKDLRRRTEAYQELVAAAQAPVPIKPGDYQVQVHVIQVAELKAEDANGLSDPVVYVDVAGQRRHTRVVKKTTACGLTVEQFEDAQIKVSVYDADTFTRNDLIGSWQVDFSTVYFAPQHEVYKQWVGLVDERSKRDHGLQGFCQLSVAVLGPGDNPPVHTASSSGDDVGSDDVPKLSSLIMLPPSVRQDLHFLVFTVHTVVDVPPLDFGSNTAAVFGQVVFAGNPPCRTHTRTAKGAGRLVAAINEQLWVPVMVPTMTHRIAFSVHVGRTAAATSYFNFKDLQAIQAAQDGAPKVKGTSQKRAGSLARFLFKSRGPQNTLKDSTGIGPIWLPMYGAPVRSGMGKVLADRFSDARRTMNRFPEYASHYRGTALLSLRIDYNKRFIEEGYIHTKRAKPLPDALIAAKSKLYTIAAMVVSGSGIPSFRGVTGQAKLSVRVSIGRLELDTLPASNAKGEVRWDQLLRYDGVALPSEAVELPDVFVYLMRGSKPVCYARLSAAGALGEAWGGDYRWVSFQRDPVVNAVSERQYPGAVLLRIGLGVADAAPKLDWEKQVEVALEALQPFELQVHVYQARNLPAARDDGSCNPYLTATCCGRRASTKRVKNTLHPTWYETLRLDVEVLQVQWRPEVMLALWDHDRLGRDVQFARLSLPLSEAYVGTGPPPPPTWFTVSLLTTKNNTNDLGRFAVPELLVSIQMVRKARLRDTLPPPLPIVPDTRPAYVEVTLVGLRNLTPRALSILQKAQVVLSVKAPCPCHSGNCPRCRPFETPGSRRPHPSSPNFLQRVLLPLNLPVAPLYLPAVSVLVRDVRMGGLVRSIVGIGSISLAGKVPWFPEYEPPRQQRVIIGPEADSGENFFLLPDLENRSAGPSFRPTADTGSGVFPGAGVGAGAGAGAGVGAGSASHIGPPSPARSRAVTAASGSSVGDDGAPTDGVDVRSVLSWAGGGETRAPVSVASSVTRRSTPAVATHPPEQRKVQGPKVVSFAVAKGKPSVGVHNTLPDLPSAEKRRKAKNKRPVGKPPPFDVLPPYLKGREMLQGSVEDRLVTAPFETYKVYRGKAAWSDSLLGYTPKTTVKHTGNVKCIVRVLESADVEPLVEMESMFRPQELVVRVYILRAFNLQPKDFNGKCDPYVKLRCGKFSVSDRKNHLKNTLSPSFHRSFEFRTVLPGASQLELDVYDHDLLSPDELVGSSAIDLEDRWFDTRWRLLGTEDVPAGVVPKKPLEVRSLWSPNSNTSQGSVEMWVDMLMPEEAAANPMIDVSLPPPEKFEVRVVIWRTRDVVAMDSVGNMNDMFARVWMEQQSAQETDIHWRCRGGAGSFNWRMKFPVEFPCQFPYMHLQLWDKDIIGSDDCIGSVVVDLSSALRTAFVTKRPVALFQRKTQKGAEQQVDDDERKAKVKKAKLAALMESKDGSGSGGNGGDTPGDAATPPDTVLTIDSDGKGSADGRDSLTQPLLSEDERGAAESKAHHPAPRRRKSSRKVSKSARVSAQSQHLVPSSSRRRSSRGKSEGGGGGGGKEHSTRKKKKTVKKKIQTKAQQERAKEDDAKEFINSIKNFLGLGHPEDATWVTIQRADDHDVTKKEDMGDVLISVEVLPISVAKLRKAGSGRSNPNMYPYLPPPVGRIKWMSLWNPLYLLRVLCGPTVVRALLCCLCLIVTIYLCVIIGPFIMTAFTFIFDVLELPAPFDMVSLYIVAAVVLCCCCLCCYICCKLKKLCCGWRNKKKEKDDSDDDWGDSDDRDLSDSSV